MEVFLLLCISMGVLQLAENTKLLYQKGEQLLLDHSFSALEFVWLGVSIWFLFQGGLSILVMLVISIFVAYHIFGWLVAFRAYQLSEETQSDAILIPLWYFKVNLAICVVFIMVAFLAYIQVNT